MLLERRLAFDRLVIPQIVETLGFYTVAVYLAWKGEGITSFTWAVLVRGVLGLVTMYIVEPWVPALVFPGKALKTYVLWAAVPDEFIFGASQGRSVNVVSGEWYYRLLRWGYIGWAKKMGGGAARLIMDSVVRVTFPTYSRLQHDKALLVKAIDKTIFGLAGAILPISSGLLFLFTLWCN